jgi:hypothetical protein
VSGGGLGVDHDLDSAASSPMDASARCVISSPGGGGGGEHAGYLGQSSNWAGQGQCPNPQP